MKLKRLFFTSVFLFSSAAAIADNSVPVIDVYGNSQQNSVEQQPQQPVSPETQVKQIQQQLDNINALDFPGQINALQTEIQQLRGELEVQSYKTSQLEKSLNAMYTNLEQRINASRPTIKVASAAPVALNQPANTATTPSNPSSPPALPVSSQSAPLSSRQKAYETAFNYIQGKQYSQAISAMQNFINQYPNGEYVDNAYYWLGELYLISGQPDNAKQAFTTLVDKYPRSPKVPDAALKLGFMAYDAGQWQQAKQLLTNVMSNYPNTSAARLAEQRLQQMSKQGNI